jgi:hypothetical protein
MFKESYKKTVLQKLFILITFFAVVTVVVVVEQILFPKQNKKKKKKNLLQFFFPRHICPTIWFQTNKKDEKTQFLSLRSKV